MSSILLTLLCLAGFVLKLTIYKLIGALFVGVVVVVINPPLPRDGGTARTAMQVHAVNLIEIRLRGKMAAHFEPVMSDW